MESGFTVRGSSATREKLPVLEQFGISPFYIRVSPQWEADETGSFFLSKALFLNIPFRRDLKEPANYKDQITSVVNELQGSKIEWVVFASSTSIYPEDLRDAREDARFVPDNPRARVLWDIEQFLLNHSGFQATVIRFAGLYGATRRIGGSLAREAVWAGGDSPVNLIHLDDCVEIVFRIVQKNIRGEIFNACSDHHPTRRELYTKAARQYGFEVPQFSEGSRGGLKIVNNAKLKNRLNYEFQHPDPLDF